MDVLEEFFKALCKEGDRLTRTGGGSIIEMTRPATGLYLRVVETHPAGHNDIGSYELFVVKKGGEKPKTRWYERKPTHHWSQLSRGKVREKCERAMR